MQPNTSGYTMFNQSIWNQTELHLVPIRPKNGEQIRFNHVWCRYDLWLVNCKESTKVENKQKEDFSQLRICRSLSPPFSFAPILMIDAHSAESIEKLIFRYLFFELWLIVYTIYGWHTGFFKCVINQKKIVQKWLSLQEWSTQHNALKRII